MDTESDSVLPFSLMQYKSFQRDIHKNRISIFAWPYVQSILPSQQACDENEELFIIKDDPTWSFMVKANQN